MSSRILVIDDEKPMQKFLRICLESDGYDVLEALSAAEGLRQIAVASPDLVLLDINLPDANGFDVLTAVREWSSMPVMMLSVVGQEQEKIRFLDAGADDFVTKPFAAGELLARIRVALRRRTQPDEAVFRSGRLEIDFSARSVCVAGNRVKLTRIEYGILRLLAANAGKVVTQTQIMREIWPDTEAETNVLRVHIAYIRKKIEERPESPELILTEPAVGYRLAILPVQQ
jgi:two-component system KDP operon response regulator KdpE